MSNDVLARTLWTTASFGDTADTLPGELTALGEHLDSCQGARGRWFALQSVIDTLDTFIASRFVSTLVVAGALIALGALAGSLVL